MTSAVEKRAFDEFAVNREFEIPNPYRIEIIGGNYHWRVRYPGIDRVSAAFDDGIVDPVIHVPENTEIVLHLKSTDFVYLFSLPQLHLKEVAVPGLDFFLTVRPMTIGEIAWEGDDMCGDPHPELNGRIVVHSIPKFENWLRQHAATPKDRE
jgi:heme/copper-type cytochrome/quinol oxidase subunit 2